MTPVFAGARRRPSTSPAAPAASITRISPPPRSDEELLTGIAAGDRRAAAALLDRYGPMVERLIRRILGHDPELTDVVHDAFATILASIHQVRDADAVKGWIATVAAHTAHRAIRKRRAARWLCFWKRGPEPIPEPSTDPDVGPRDALRRMYRALDRLPADERVAFALRYIDDMGVQEVAEVCGVSYATIKRRLGRAERRFLAAAKGDAVLRGWIEEGDRWTDR